MLGGNKLNCFKATQVLGGPTQILIWGSKIAKGEFILPDKLRGTRSYGIKGRPIFFWGGPMNPNDVMPSLMSILVINAKII